MITRAQEMKVTIRDELFGGKGAVKSSHFLNQEDAAGTGRQFARSVLAPGNSIGYHTHKGDFEVYYILSGTARVNDNGEEHILHAGDSILTRNGESHSMENAGDVDLEYIALILFNKDNS
jgi:mannose-6-phosphate isomerase-like protein (cupin superfamily)